VADLRLLAGRQQEVERDIELAVRALIDAGQSWTVVGQALGLSRQGARQRYRRLLAGGARDGGTD
jgi:hypothetical protein